MVMRRRTPTPRPRIRAFGALLLTAAVAVPLAACAPAETGPPVLNWYINPDDGGQAAIAQSCTAAANGAYSITTQVLPRQAASQREQLARRLAANDSSIDIMSLDPPFIPEFAEAGFLAPVPEDVRQKVTQNVVQGAIDGATWKDELVTVPFWANTQLLWYRKSVVEAAGLDMSKPVTWQQIMDAAQSQDKYLAVQGARAESLTVWVNALIASDGGSIITSQEGGVDSIELGIDSDAGKAAAEIMGEIGTSGLGGPGLPTADETASLSLFQSDKGSFMVNYPFVWPATKASVENGSLDQSVLDDIGWAVYPAVDESKPAAPPYGGINLGISSKGNNVDLAYQAAECIVSPENQTEYFVSNGNPASNTTAFDDPAVSEAFPMASTIRDSLQQAAPRPQTPYYNEISLGIQSTWHPPGADNADTTPAQSQSFILQVLRGERLL